MPYYKPGLQREIRAFIIEDSEERTDKTSWYIRGHDSRDLLRTTRIRIIRFANGFNRCNGNPRSHLTNNSMIDDRASRATKQPICQFAYTSSFWVSLTTHIVC